MIDEDDEPRYYDRGERWDRSVLLGIVLFCFFAQKSDFSAVEVGISGCSSQLFLLTEKKSDFLGMSDFFFA